MQTRSDIFHYWGTNNYCINTLITVTVFNTVITVKRLYTTYLFCKLFLGKVISACITETDLNYSGPYLRLHTIHPPDFWHGKRCWQYLLLYQKSSVWVVCRWRYGQTKLGLSYQCRLIWGSPPFLHALFSTFFLHTFFCI